MILIVAVFRNNVYNTSHISSVPGIKPAPMNFDCFNCIRECPEEAISPAMPLAKISAMIRERAATFDEQPPTQVW